MQSSYGACPGITWPGKIASCDPIMSQTDSLVHSPVLNLARLTQSSVGQAHVHTGDDDTGEGQRKDCEGYRTGQGQCLECQGEVG